MPSDIVVCPLHFRAALLLQPLGGVSLWIKDASALLARVAYRDVDEKLCVFIQHLPVVHLGRFYEIFGWFDCSGSEITE